MKKENPESFAQRIFVLKMCERLIHDRRANTLKEAAKEVWNKSRQWHTTTGFSCHTFDKFYSSIRKFKSKIHKNSQTTKKYLYDYSDSYEEVVL